MKVIFLEDIPNIARAGEERIVANGYGRNFLLPRKLAVLADSRAAGVVEAHLKVLARKQAETEAEMRQQAKQLDGKEIIIKAKAGEKNRLYGSVTSAAIADALVKSTGIAVDKRKIELAEPIHELGTYTVTIRYVAGVEPKITVKVESEEETKTELPPEIKELIEPKKVKTDAEEKPKKRKKSAEKEPVAEVTVEEKKPAETETEKPKKERKPRAKKVKTEEAEK